MAGRLASLSAAMSAGEIHLQNLGGIAIAIAPVWAVAIFYLFGGFLCQTMETFRTKNRIFIKSGTRLRMLWLKLF
jgi:hypothetical protein